MAKTNRPMVRIHNSETNEIIDREMTDDELATHQESQQIELERKSAESQKAAEKAALLERLGITADEAKLLLA
jgi:hypothetical protein